MTAAVAAALRRGPLDVVALAAALRRADPELTGEREGHLHAMLHGLLRRGIVRTATGGGGLVRYVLAGQAGETDAPKAPPLPLPTDPRDVEAAKRIASVARLPTDRARIAADVAAHLRALREQHLDRAFGSKRSARYVLRRVDRGSPTVMFASGSGDKARRFLLHEGPWLLCFVVAFLVIRAYVAEVFWIPSDSMVPTLLQGDRVVVFRPGGQKMPDRWDIVTFERNGLTVVKRVVGLGGESILLFGGDVYIGHGEREPALVRKNDELRQALRLPYRAWTFTGLEAEDWKHEDRLGEVVLSYAGGALPSCVEEGDPKEDVGLRDVYVALELDRPAQGTVALDLAYAAKGAPEDEDPAYVIRLLVGERETEVALVREAGAIRLARSSEPAPVGLQTMRLSYVDGVVRAHAGGRRLVAELPPERRPPLGAVVRPVVRILTAGPRLHRLVLEKDIHYTRKGDYAIVPAGSDESPMSYAFQIPEDKVFLLGDNSFLSNDSRVRSVGPVKLDELVGPVRFRIWPLGRLGRVR